MEITQVPPKAEGGSERLVPIAGRTRGAPRGSRVVLYARSTLWWVQPFGNEPFTEIAGDGTWKTETHLGSDYAALLVTPDYKPAPTAQELPAKSASVLAVVTVPGSGGLAERPRKTIAFSGYEWEVRQVSSDRGGANSYSADNAWVDENGHLHLKLAQRDGQ